METQIEFSIKLKLVTEILLKAISLMTWKMIPYSLLKPMNPIVISTTRKKGEESCNGRNLHYATLFTYTISAKKFVFSDQVIALKGTENGLDLAKGT